jgi:hypothetical protein
MAVTRKGEGRHRENRDAGQWVSALMQNPPTQYGRLL